MTSAGNAGAVYTMNFFEDGMNVAKEKDRSRLMNISSVMLFRNPIPTDKLRKSVSKLFQFDRCRSKISKNKRTGKHEFVDLGDCTQLLDRMVFETQMKRGDDAELQEFQESTLFKDFNEDLPQWEVHILRNYKWADGTVGMALVWRLNHCLGDGMTLVQVLLSLTDDASDDNKPLARRLHQSSGILDSMSDLDEVQKQSQSQVAKPSAWRGVWGVLVAAACFPAALVSVIVGTELWDSRTCMQWVKKKHPPATRKAMRMTKEFPVDKIKALSKRMGATINDVLMASVGGFCRRYMLKKGDPAVRRGVMMRANMAVSLSPKRITDPIEFGVNLSFVQIDLLAGVPDLPTRASKMRRNIEWIKMSGSAWIAYVLQWILATLAGQFFFQWKIAATGERSHFAVSNVVGPRSKVSLAGEMVERIMFWANPSNLSCLFGIVTYGGSASVGALMDTNVVEDPELLMRCIEEEFDDMIAAAC